MVGKTIVLASDRTGSWEIWVCDSDGSNPVQLTSFRGPRTGTPRWSPDGQRIAFDSRPQGRSDIFIIGAEGICLFRVTGDPPTTELFDLATHQLKRIAALEKAPRLTGPRGFDVSPDGQWVLYSRVDHVESDIMLVENFR